MEDFSGIGIEHKFVQDGERNRHGYYQINDWGPANKNWIVKNLQYVIGVLQKGRKLIAYQRLSGERGCGSYRS